MAINYSTEIKNVRLEVVRAAIDAGAAPGKVCIYTAQYVFLLAAIEFAYPCGIVADGILTFSGLPKSGIGVREGNAAIARVYDSKGTIISDGHTVGMIGTDLVIDSVTIAAGKTVTLLAGSIIHG